MRELARTVRAVGTVQADERRQAVVSTKFEGWVEKLHVNATGQVVRRGQPLMDVYAPELVIAQQEYLLAWQALKDMGGADPMVRASGKQLADAALQRLKNWDISADQLRRLQKDGTARRTLTLRAPMDATVMEKTAVEGMRFAAGDPLYRLVDLSSVWLIADVFEQDLAAVRGRGGGERHRRGLSGRHLHRQGRLRLSLGHRRRPGPPRCGSRSPTGTAA